MKDIVRNVQSTDINDDISIFSERAFLLLPLIFSFVLEFVYFLVCFCFFLRNLLAILSTSPRTIKSSSAFIFVHHFLYSRVTRLALLPLRTHILMQ